MMIKINDDREFEIKTLYSGYLEENKSITLEFEFPEYLEKYNKKANFMLADGTTLCKLFDDINSNKFTFTRDLLKFNKLQMAIEFFDTDENLIYRTSILTIRISDSIICDDDVSEDDPKVIILNELIQKVNDLNTEVTESEATRESNEQTRISNENTRISNETARQEYVTQLKKDVELGNLDGATFTPQVSENGDLSWTNNKGLENPETVNIKGEKGDKGDKGDTGVGISKLEVIDGALYVTLTNNVKENAGVILTDEVKSWLVSQITDNAESDFNTYYNSKVTEFNTNATEKTTAYNTNAEDKLNEYNTNATNKINEYNTNAEAILKILPKTETEVLEEIDIDDSAESSFNKLSVFGNSRQESTEGYNLFNIDSVTDTILNVSNGKEISNSSWRTSDFIEIEPSNSYLFSIKYENLFFQLNYCFYDNNKNFISGKSIEQHNIYKTTIETPENAYFIKLSYSVSLQGEHISRNEIMFIKGTEEKPYEPYTGGNPSPNPDYPQEIESIKDSITFKRINANLLDISDLYTETTVNGVNIKYNNDGTLTLKGTATGQIQLALRAGDNLKNGDYSFKNFGSPSNIATNIYYIGDVYGETVRSFTITEEHNYAIVYVIPINTTINATIKPMLVKGKYDNTTFPDFQQYKEENYTLPVQQEMLKINDYEDLFIKKDDGNWYERHVLKKYIIDGENNVFSNMSVGEVFTTFDFYPEGLYEAIFTKQEFWTTCDNALSNMFKPGNLGQLSSRVNINYLYTLATWGSYARFSFENNKFASVDEANQYLSELNANNKPLILYVALKTPEEILCTAEQTAVLNQLEQFSLEKGINHIFSDDELSPKFQLKYYQDMNILLDKINKNIADVSAQLL